MKLLSEHGDIKSIQPILDSINNKMNLIDTRVKKISTSEINLIKTLEGSIQSTILKI